MKALEKAIVPKELLVAISTRKQLAIKFILSVQDVAGFYVGVGLVAVTGLKNDKIYSDRILNKILTQYHDKYL